MKKSVEILIDNLTIADKSEISEFTLDRISQAMKEYAEQCCEDLRERIAEKIEAASGCSYLDCGGYSESQEDVILGTEIILP